MINVAVQYVATKNISELTVPSESQFSLWANTANVNITEQVELTIRIVDENESAELNETYRNKKTATNVLAFPFDVDESVELKILGDIVICAKIVEFEAQQQLKTVVEHWAHIVMHGVLHLQGYDHINLKQAEEMENLEIRLLKNLGYENPYQVNEQ